MSGSVTQSNSFGGRGKKSQEFELNLTALIDCFTVLISFMLVATSFVSIGILDAGVAASGANTTKTDSTPYLLTIELKSDHMIELKVTGKGNFSGQVTPTSGNWNYASLEKQLGDIKSRFQGLEAATLVANNSAEYDDVVKAMESAHKVIPAVLLGGF